MPRVFDLHPNTEARDLRLTGPDGARRKATFAGWLHTELTDGLSARFAWEAQVHECLRQYEGVPAEPYRSNPVENAPNIEITLGAIAADVIYAQAIDLIFTLRPPVTARDVRGDKVDATKALQRLIDWGSANEWELREAADHTLLDDVQLGTGVYYIPFTETRKKTRVHRVLERGPKIYSVPIEDFLVPGGAVADVQRTRWAAMRWWWSRNELDERGKARKWDTDGIVPASSPSSTREFRERLAGHESRDYIDERYAIWQVYVDYDIDEDGADETLEVFFSLDTGKILGLEYNPYDRRPIEAARYQLRAHMFYGLGVLKMAMPYQQEVTDLHNERTLNARLANARVWKGREGQLPDNFKVWAGKFVGLTDIGDFDAIPMADVYTGGTAQAEAITTGLAERRVGVNELTSPRPSQVLGSRTPGITALTYQQQANRRFTPAFDQIRLATSGAVRQCLYRYQEILLAGGDLGRDIEAQLATLFGDEDATHIIRLLKDEHFDESFAVELTATSISVNKEADRQNMLALIGILGGYYEKALQLTMIAANPQVPEPVRDVAKKIATAASELIDRALRTFDQIRDPQRFVIDMEAELDATPVAPNGLGQLVSMLGLAGGPQAVGAGAAPSVNGAGVTPLG